MRVQTEEWRRFIPGVRIYKGKKTLFWNGEKIYDSESGEYLVFSEEEQRSWKVVIVLPGVEVIHDCTFATLDKLETVIMSDTVLRIEDSAFDGCTSLEFVKLSRNLEYIGIYAFQDCESLTSIFIPPTCREIDESTFIHCCKLIIFHVSRHTMIGRNAIIDTALFEASPFEVNASYNYEEINEWVKDTNHAEEYELHRACSSFNPLNEIIYGIVKRKGPSAFKMENILGLTPFDYLEANPFTNIQIDQKTLMKRYILEKMGETV